MRTHVLGPQPHQPESTLSTQSSSAARQHNLVSTLWCSRCAPSLSKNAWGFCHVYRQLHTVAVPYPERQVVDSQEGEIARMQPWRCSQPCPDTYMDYGWASLLGVPNEEFPPRLSSSYKTQHIDTFWVLLPDVLPTTPSPVTSFCQP